MGHNYLRMLLQLLRRTFDALGREKKDTAIGDGTKGEGDNQGQMGHYNNGVLTRPAHQPRMPPPSSLFRWENMPMTKEKTPAKTMGVEIVVYLGLRLTL